MTKEQIIEAVKNMTVLELNELVKAIEEEFGVTAAAPVAVMGGAAGGALIRSATSWSNIRKPVSTGSVRVRCWCCAP